MWEPVRNPPTEKAFRQICIANGPDASGALFTHWWILAALHARGRIKTGCCAPQSPIAVSLLLSSSKNKYKNYETSGTPSNRLKCREYGCQNVYENLGNILYKMVTHVLYTLMQLPTPIYVDCIWKK
jgi:hypothetical protein